MPEAEVAELCAGVVRAVETWARRS
jgi:hypothetical protein